MNAIAEPLRARKKFWPSPIDMKCKHKDLASELAAAIIRSNWRRSLYMAPICDMYRFYAWPSDKPTVKGAMLVGTYSAAGGGTSPQNELDRLISLISADIAETMDEFEAR